MSDTKIKFYVLLLIVFLLSFCFFSLIPGELFLKNFAATPALCALLAAIYQILKDHSAHLKQIELQEKQQNFSLSTSSHMAQKVFDKNIEFCEKYIAEIHKTATTLWIEGPTQLALDHGRTLYGLKVEYSTWITDEISNKLKEFEEALYELGAKTRLSEKVKNPHSAEKAAEEADKIWEDILGMWFSKEKAIENERIAINAVINFVRDILGVNELIELRNVSVKQAISKLRIT